MEKVLGDNTKGIIASLSNDNHADGLAKSLKAVVGKFPGNGAAVEVPKAEYDAVVAAVEKITTAITDTLDAGDLTQLDTSNLKSIKSDVENVGKAFSSIEEMKLVNDKYTVEVADLDKVSKALENIIKAREEVGASATKALESSKAQAENIKEMLLRMVLKIKTVLRALFLGFDV